MKIKAIGIGTGIALAAGLGVAQAQTPNTVDAHMAAAKAAAGLEWSGTFTRLCVPPPVVIPVAAPAPAAGANPRPPTPARDTWYTEPGKVFDNLYFVGSKIHSSWALVGSEGIILIDTIYDYNSDEEILGGFKKLGLDINKVKYLIVSHSHLDHDGGVKLIQDTVPGVRTIEGGADWDTMEKATTGYWSGKPKRDISATDGQVVSVGDASVKIVLTPGHTPGTLSYIFQVKDNGKPVNIAYSGGTAIPFDGKAEFYDQYIASSKKFQQVAADAHATVLMSNHTEFDGASVKAKAVAGLKPGETNPFIVGEKAVQNYFTVGQECATAAKIRAGGGLPPKAP